MRATLKAANKMVDRKAQCENQRESVGVSTCVCVCWCVWAKCTVIMHFSISLSAQFVLSLSLPRSLSHFSSRLVACCSRRRRRRCRLLHTLWPWQNVPLGVCLLRSCYSIQKRPPRSTVGGVTTLAGWQTDNAKGKGQRKGWGEGRDVSWG